MYDPKQFLGKRVYNDSELELLRTTVTCKTLTESERFTIMEQAVAPCPEINHDHKKVKRYGHCLTWDPKLPL